MLKLMILQIDSFGALPVIIFAVLAIIIIFVTLTKVSEQIWIKNQVVTFFKEKIHSKAFLI